MGKKSLKPYNDYCPQTLYLYGTYDENGKPEFGLFCWFSYIWDGEMGVMCCIGGSKPTLDNIKRNKIFSANLVTQELLSVADYLGIVSGKDPDKMNIELDIGKGEVLDVPILNNSPVNLKLVRIAPVKTTCKHYFSYEGKDLGAWGEPMKAIGHA